MLADITSGASPTWAGLLTAVAGCLTAAGVLLGSLAVLVPVLRNVRRQGVVMDKIHTLANGMLTAAKTDALLATERELAALRKLPAGAEAMANIAGAERRIADLRAELVERVAIRAAEEGRAGA